MNPRLSPVFRYLSSLRRRAAALVVLAAVMKALGVGVFVFALVALGQGPLGSVWSNAFAWFLVAALTSATLFAGLSNFIKVRGSAIANLINPVNSMLASEARTAYELGRSSPSVGISPDLIFAHERRLAHRLAGVPLFRVTPFRELFEPRILLAGALAVIGVTLVQTTDRARAGAYALLHPIADDGGAPMAELVGDASLGLVFPAHWNRDPESIGGWVQASAPRGTAITATIRLLIDAESVVLDLGETNVPLVRDQDGKWTGEWILGGDVRAQVVIVSGEDRVRDRQVRTVDLVVDQPPEVRWIAPASQTVIEPDRPVRIEFRASDDVGLRELRLMVQAPGAPVHSQRIQRLVDVKTEHSGTVDFLPSDITTVPGDSLEAWIEAEDADTVSGPHVGRSETITLVVVSEILRRAAELENLESLLNLGVQALADRLEAIGSESLPPNAALTVAALIDGLEAQAAQPDTVARDAGLFRDLARQIRQAAARRPAATVDEDRAVHVLEDAVLALSDLIEHYRMEDVALMARELSALRQQIASLLEQLRRTDSEETRRQIMAAIARAESRYRELMSRLSQMGEQVPGEFANRQANEGGAAQSDPFGALRAAIEQNDFEAAARQLLELERDITELAEALGRAEDELEEERFGEQDRALAELLDRLVGLENEQRELLRSSNEVRRRGAERALSEARGNGLSELGDQASDLQEEVRGFPENHFDALEREAWDRAQQRFEDTAVALDNEDLGEARMMLEGAAQDLESLSRDLDVSALMFPGHDGQTAESARRAEQALRRVRELQRSLDRAIPSLADHLDAGDRQQLSGDASRQGNARSTAEDIASDLRESAENMMPDAEAEFSEIGEAMQRATRALERHDPIDASGEQEDAARRITALRERLEQRRSQSSSGGDGSQGGDGSEGSSTFDHRQRVEIPEAGEGNGPTELRRRVLGGMGESPPRGYEEAVRDYYDGLLR